MNDRAQVFVLASYIRDISMLVDRAPQAGESRIGRDARETPGGKGSNQAVQAARCGAKVSIAAALGDDEAGQAACRLWEAEGIWPAVLVRRGDLATGLACVIVEDGGENRIVVAPGANAALAVTDVDSAGHAIEAATLVMATLETPIEATVRAFELARAAGIQTLLNTAPAPDDASLLPAALWSTVDLLVANEGEAASLCARPVGTDPAELGPLLSRRVRVGVVITLGAGGAMYWRASQGAVADSTVLSCSAPVIAAVDTTGAGDAFTGAFATWWAQTGGDAAVALRHGVAAGTTACLQRGCVPAFAPRAEIEAMAAGLSVG
jgi:ribokinase